MTRFVQAVITAMSREASSFRLLPVFPIVFVVFHLLLRCSWSNNHSNRLLVDAWSNGALRKSFSVGTHISHGSTSNRMIQLQPAIRRRRHTLLLLLLRRNDDDDDATDEAVAGSFFNPIPQPPSDSGGGNGGNSDTYDDDVATAAAAALSKAIQPSTINGIPSERVGLDLGMTLQQQQQAVRQKDPITRKPYVGIGPSSLNDVTKPEYDDQGYTLYVDERTGTKARVFEALVNYPCLFTLKIVGANDDTFVQDVLQIVATTCEINTTEETNEEASSVSSAAAESSSSSLINTNQIEHSIKYNGKWASITVQAPVQSAQMLYQLYENVDRDPRVKFKF